MDVTKYTKIVLSRIQDLELGDATKIIQYLVLKHSQQEIMEYALGPDMKILSLISEAKASLFSSSKPNTLNPICPPFSSLSSDQQPPVNNFDSVGDLHHQGEQLHPSNLLEPNSSGSETASVEGLALTSTSRSPPGSQEFPAKPCHYFNKSQCKRGGSPEFSHGQTIPDVPGNQDQATLPESLEKLEMEIMVILKSMNGIPISVASLPKLYLEKYGKPLQAEGYLSDSQQHGKTCFTLMQLLSRLKSIRLIDRPYGVLAVVPAEDAPKYSNETSDPGEALAISLQIYITFPPESNFTDEDVVNYFRKFGPIRDVRIPNREKRMFGFVSFYYPETAELILAMGQPHYIGGCKVLAKPYTGKSSNADRIYAEKLRLLGYYQFLKMYPDINALSMVCDDLVPLKKQLIEQHATELERKRLLELQLLPKQPMPHPNTYYRMDEQNIPEDWIRNKGSTSGSMATQICTNYSEQDSGNIELSDALHCLGSSILTAL